MEPSLEQPEALAECGTAIQENTSRDVGTGVAEREGLAHDACNLLAAVGLYCDLMSQPGVVTAGHQHYLEEMRRLAKRSEALIERLMPREAVQLAQTAMGRAVYQPSRSNASHQGQGTETAAYDFDATAAFDAAFDATVNAVVLAAERAEAAICGEVDGEDTSGCRGILPSVVAGSIATQQQAVVDGVDVARHLEGSRDMLQIIVGSGVMVEVETQVPVGVRLGMDEESLERVLVNLTVNARDAMPEGGRLRVTAQWAVGGASHEVPRDLPVVLISVQDSGPGMPPELVAKLNSGADGGVKSGDGSNSRSKRDGRRHGLGLEIVRELVVAAGGKLRVLSAKAEASPNSNVCLLQGTRFEIALPLLSQHSLFDGHSTEGHEAHNFFTNDDALDRRAGNDHATMSATKRSLQLVSPSCETTGSVTARTKRRGGQALAAKAITSSAQRGPAIC